EPTTLNTRQVTIIGSNGSGKSRFCDNLMAQCKGKAYRMSVLRALFPFKDRNPLEGSINQRFEQLNAQNQLAVSYADNEFDKLTYILLTDEFRDLLNYKAHLLMGEEMEFPKTKLDMVVKLWQEVFPKNKVLRENGKLMFSTKGRTDRYSSLRLSDGEKAVLYYIGAVLYAMPEAVILVEDPETFIHPSIMRTLWNVIEELRPDCTFIYNTHDLDFASSRIDNTCIWVKSFDPEAIKWDYEVTPSSQNLSDALYYELLGNRKPVLFIEGDETHSIDSRLYPLIFPEYTVKPIGGCNNVIESVRAFNSLQSFHHLDSWGVVDRDRRNDEEVAYLREKKIFVPNVAEIENILMLEGVVRAVARYKHCDENLVFKEVKKNVFDMFRREFDEQVLMHVRHYAKRALEKNITPRVNDIGELNRNIQAHAKRIDVNSHYQQLSEEFDSYLQSGNYAMVLRVFNQKLMLSESQVAHLCKLKNKKEYIKTVLNILKGNNRGANDIRRAIKQCFGIKDDKPQVKK
ncbi:MAG: DUF4435 domain-containing protein, partial [Muribaculaceae bacterium]|nr:DUF4435 domain-containing protein [Muribaculaceae bacterium]